MQDTILPFDLVVPDAPLLIDVDALYQRFAQVPDQRQQRGKRSSLAFVLTIAVLAKLAGEDTVEAIAEWARLRDTELTALFRRQRTQMPHPTTWQRILRHAVEPQTLTQAVAEVLSPATTEVSPQRAHLLAGCHIPELHQRILAGRCQQCSIWIECDIKNTLPSPCGL